MFSKCAQFKKQPYSEHFKNSYCFVFENGILNLLFARIKFREFYARKSRNLILAKVSKNTDY